MTFYMTCFHILLNLAMLAVGYFFGRATGMIQAYYMDKKQLRQKIWGNHV